MLPLLLSTLERPEEKRIFTLFFQAHEQGLLRYARSLTGSPVLGEEVCQEAWMKCLQHAETFFAIPPDRRLGWMVVIVKHTAYSLLEKEGRHLPLDPDWDAPAPEAGDVQGIVDLIRALDRPGHRPGRGSVCRRRQRPGEPGPETPPTKTTRGGIP